jgi:succinyl-CoA synthetase beta subunit
MSFDDNALFRRRNIVELNDPSQSDPREAQAAEHALNYIGLDGEIGCIVNGAGLAMATMDMIKRGRQSRDFRTSAARIGGPRRRRSGLCSPTRMKVCL